MSRKLLIATVFAVLLCSGRAKAQGCSQCRDNIAQTPPKVRAAYRHAIILMASAATGIFIAALLIARAQRHDPPQN